MWLILLLRVVCPVFPESYLSIYNLIPAGKEIMLTLTYDDWSDQSVIVEAVEEEHTAVSDTLPLEEASAIPDNRMRSSAVANLPTENSRKEYTFSEAVFAVYGLGVLVATATHFFMYHKAVRKLKKNISPCFDNELEKQYRNIADRLNIRRVPELYRGERSLTVGYVKPIIVLQRGGETG